jgi:hypothetical protein
VKAHPDDFGEGANEKLGAYYQSDKQLRLRQVSKKHEGWLVAAWQDAVVNGRTSAFWSWTSRKRLQSMRATRGSAFLSTEQPTEQAATLRRQGLRVWAALDSGL